MRWAWAMILILAGMVGCRTAPPQPVASAPARSNEAAAQTLAFVNGRAVTGGQLQSAVFEMAGREALGELVLDRVIDERGITVTGQEMAAERGRMLRMLAEDPDEAARLLAELRRRRGLGEVRWAAMLRRNAALRKMVAAEVTVTPQAVGVEYELLHGPRYQARVIVTTSLQRAADLRVAVEREPFADLAMAHSTDPSAAAGGRLSPITPVDDAYPQVIRDVLASLAEGSVSQPVAVEGGFAILKLEATIPGSGVPLDQVRPELEERVRLRAERLRMDQLARDLVAGANVVVLDGDLSRAWKSNPDEHEPPRREGHEAIQ